MKLMESRFRRDTRKCCFRAESDESVGFAARERGVAAAGVKSCKKGSERLLEKKSLISGGDQGKPPYSETVDLCIPEPGGNSGEGLVLEWGQAGSPLLGL